MHIIATEALHGNSRFSALLTSFSESTHLQLMRYGLWSENILNIFSNSIQPFKQATHLWNWLNTNEDAGVWEILLDYRTFLFAKEGSQFLSLDLSLQQRRHFYQTHYPCSPRTSCRSYTIENSNLKTLTDQRFSCSRAFVGQTSKKPPMHQRIHVWERCRSLKSCTCFISSFIYPSAHI